MIKCVAYVRVSTEKQVEEGYGLDSQERDIKEYARKNNLIISKWYKDEGISGMSMTKRVELQNLISDININNIERIIVYKLDRLSRNTTDALYMIDKIFTPKGVVVDSVHDFAKYETPQDKFQTHIMSAVAEYDRNTMLLRMRGGILERVKKGYFTPGGNLPYCYSYNKNTGMLEVIPERAEKARKAMQMYIDGYSDRQIGQILGISFSTVKSVLMSETNIGKVIYKGNIYDGLHEPIFDEESYYKALEIRKAKGARFNRNPNKKVDILAGLCYCGVCGCRMRIVQWGKYPAIVCYSRDKCKSHIPNYNPNCNNKVFKMVDIEEAVRKSIEDIAVNIEKKPIKKVDYEQLYTDEIASLKTKLKRLYEFYADGNDAVIEVIKGKETRLAELNKLLDEQNSINKSKVTQKEQFENTIKKVADIWDKADNKDINTFLKSIIDKIIIVNDSVEIQLKYYSHL